MFDGTIFGKRKKPFYDMVQYIKCWSIVMTLANAIQLLKFANISTCRRTLGLFYGSLRNVCTIALDKKNLKLGGEGQAVEIDGSIFAHVKYTVDMDSFRKQVWVFGLVERSSGRVYFQTVPDRQAETLLAIIYERVLPGTLIYSDCLGAYQNIEKLHTENLQHNAVSHSLYFADEDLLAVKNLVKSYWCQAKVKLNEMRGCNRRFFQSYLDEFMWRNNNQLRGRDAFDQIINDCAKVYEKFNTHEIEGEISNINGPDENYIGDGEVEKISLREYENEYDGNEQVN
jgi:transposase-like protein